MAQDGTALAHALDGIAWTQRLAQILLGRPVKRHLDPIVPSLPVEVSLGGSDVHDHDVVPR